MKYILRILLFILLPKSVRYNHTINSRPIALRLRALAEDTELIHQ